MGSQRQRQTEESQRNVLVYRFKKPSTNVLLVSWWDSSCLGKLEPIAPFSCRKISPPLIPPLLRNIWCRKSPPINRFFCTINLEFYHSTRKVSLAPFQFPRTPARQRRNSDLFPHQATDGYSWRYPIDGADFLEPTCR